ncbi:hypothetical protein Ancab_028690 [Ancistrocladus abbreviatus]
MLKGIFQSLKTVPIRQAATQFTNLGMIVTSALMLWKLLICLSGSESPVVVVLTGSMEPGFRRGRDIPIVHRVIKVNIRRETTEINLLTKGDNNEVDDSHGRIYADGQRWLERDHVTGRVIGYLPYVGWVTIIMTEKPLIKYLLIGALSALVITAN